MTRIAVVAHTRKTLDGGLDELRSVLAREGVVDPLWYEVPKSKRAPRRVRDAIDSGADLVFLWGGDGMVQRSLTSVVGSHAVVAVIPAGTANLLASNLGIPKSISEAVAVGLHGTRRMLDVGVVNGEHFAVMAGAGFDARMIGEADHGLKDRAGRLAYVFTALKNVGVEPTKTTIKVDGKKWFKGRASCVLVGNVGRLFAGLKAFEHARPDDGQLELGVVTAAGAWQWARTLARTATSKPDKSRFVRTTRGRRLDVRFRDAVAYELDGGARSKTKRLRFEIKPRAITICVPEDGA